jgi:diguanylate cyclase (GGDEF)-like protein/PAS domain S-box-containing protein
LLIAALLLGLHESSAWAGSEVAPVAVGAVTLPPAAAWGIGLLLAGALAGAVMLAQAARRHAAVSAACNDDLVAANRSLQDEIARWARVEDERTAHQRERDEGTQSLTQMNALLGEASGRFQELFQGLPVACVCCDREGRVMEWNRAWTRLHGLANPLGRTVSDLLGGMERMPALAEAMEAARAGEARAGVMWTYRRPDGARVHVSSSLFPQRGADDSVTGVLGADVDISAQQEAEDALRQSEERMHALYNTTSQQGLSFAEKMDALLALGGAQFGLEVGIAARVTGDNYEVLQAVSPGGAIRPGLTFAAAETFCAQTLARAASLSFEQAGQTDRRGTPAYRQFGLEAYIGTPIRVDGEVWGMLCFAGAKPSPRLFTCGDREMVRLMAQWIGGEVARRQAEEAVQASEERFRTAIASMSEGLIVMGADGVIRLWNDSAERILEKTRGEMHGWRPLNPDFVPVREDGSRFPNGSYPLMVSLRRGEPQTDVVMGLPRGGGGMVWVSVNAKPLFPPGGAPDASPSAVVATFADITERRRQENLITEQMGQIKEHTAVLEAQKRELEVVNAELETLALRDGLTGLSNRRAFGQRLALEMNRAARYGMPLSLLLLDVDRFKDYNDTFGHVAGDDVLRTLSQVLFAQGRETDFFARYGGEEFVVILPHTGSEGAQILAERLRLAISRTAWTARPVTASIGAATLLPDMSAEDDLVSAADRALYAAKAAGRNRVVHALSLGDAAPTSLSSAAS